MSKRDKIFNAAAKLFAERSFNSVGIRDIAKKAEVNSAMISYYFGSKTGLLREIFSDFSEMILWDMRQAIAESNDHYELCDKNISKSLDSARANRDVYLVGLRELNHESSELKDLREQMHSQGWELFSGHLKKHGLNTNRETEDAKIVFSAILGIVFSDYLLGGGRYIDDDKMIGKYKKVISSILKNGSPAFWE